MALREIKKHNDLILRKKCKKVDKISDRIILLLEDMAETMYKAEGVGLAAPQVGILRQVAVIDIGEGLIELINPEIIETSGEQIEVEGCLSLPDITGKVKRPLHVKVKALDRYGKKQIITGTELLARALSHEIDHLKGILFVDKTLPEEKGRDN